jgi:hypothetical protein
MNEKIQSSAASGYLLLSKLRDSSYTFTVGFPQSKWPEQKFTVAIKGKDHGYLLKNFDEKGWGLFDLQTLAVQMSETATQKKDAAKTEMKEASAFMDVLAKAANDPSLKERVVQVKMEEKPIVAQQALLVTSEKAPVRKEEPIPQKEESVQNIGSAVVKPATDNQSPAKAEETKAEKEIPKAIVKVESEEAKTEKEIPKAVVKIETEKPPMSPPVKDTVTKSLAVKTAATEKLAEPVLKKEEIVPEKQEQKQVAKSTEKPAEASEITAVVTEKTKAAPADVKYKKSTVVRKSESSTSEGFGLTFIDQHSDGKKDTVNIMIPNPKIAFADMKSEAKKQADVVAAKPVNKKTCPAVASENDFLKLRKKMAGEKGNEPMINEAKRIYKSKCVSTAQVKNLGHLFMDDAGRYLFFDASYAHVSDPENFPTLQAELKEAYFLNRFKALLR